MNCPVCLKPCEEMFARGSYSGGACLGCGRIRLRVAMRQVLRVSMFNVPAARQRLQTTPVPMLGAAGEDLLRSK